MTEENKTGPAKSGGATDAGGTQQRGRAEAAEGGAKAASKAGAATAKSAGQQGDLSRRDFLRIGLFGTALLFLAQIAGTFATYFWPRKVGAFGGEINLGHYSQFPPGTVTKVDAGKFYLVHHPTDGLLAIYWRCTHLGCTVPWKPDSLTYLNPPGCFCCNCHGSQFNFVGDYVAGPAPRPLDIFPVRIEANGDVIVDTGTVIERERYVPEEQAARVPA